LIDIVLLEVTANPGMMKASALPQDSQGLRATASQGGANHVKNLWNIENPVENGWERSRLTWN
jgi:hypothetical protein